MRCIVMVLVAAVSVCVACGGGSIPAGNEDVGTAGDVASDGVTPDAGPVDVARDEDATGGDDTRPADVATDPPVDVAGDTRSDAGPDAISEPTVLFEIVPDDRVADGSFLPVDAGGPIAGAMLAVPLTPPGRALLHTVRVSIAADSAWNDAFFVHVYAADGPGGAPGTSLLDEPVTGRLTEAPLGTQFIRMSRFTDVALPAPVAVGEGTFYVAVQWAGAQGGPGIAVDAHHSGSATWFRTGDDAAWATFPDAFGVDPGWPMVRAVVAIPESAAPDLVEVGEATLDSLGHPALWPGEPQYYGTWIAARITPPSAPFEVVRVRYDLHNGLLVEPGGPTVVATLPHRVQVFVAGDEPPNDPDVLASFDVAVTADVSGIAVEPVYLDVDPPIVVGEGQRLFVAIELVGDPATNTINGIGTTDDVSVEDAVWWSPAPPFAWISESREYDWTEALRVFATGRVLPQ